MGKQPIKSRYSKEAKAFGKHLRTLRKAKGMTQEDVAYNAEVSFTTINLLENGSLNPTFSTLVAISKGMKTPLKTLMDF